MRADRFQRPSRSLALAFGALALALIASRFAWEAIDPLEFEVSKAWIYVRDGLTLGPAAVLGAFSIAFSRERAWTFVRPKRTVLAASVLAGLCSAVVARVVLLGTPAIADEAGYLWMAALLASGSIVGDPTGPATLIQYVGDYQGNRVSAFFPGSSLPLAVGYGLDVEWLVNPVLTGALVAVTFWAGRRLFSDRVGVLGAILVAASPFVLWQGASYFSQTWTALLAVPAFVFGLSARRNLDYVLAGLLGSLVLFSRPASAAVVVVVIGGAIAVARRSFRSRLTSLVFVGLGGLAPLAGFGALNWAMTGNPLVTGHRALLPDETAIVGVSSLVNAGLNLAGLAVEITVPAFLGFALVVVGLWKFRREPLVLAIGAYGLAQLAGYSLYYNHGISYGPRYLLEVTPLLLLVGAKALLGFSFTSKKVPQFVALCLVMLALGSMPGRAYIYNDRAMFLDLAPVEAAIAKPAVVVVGEGPFEFPDPFYPAFANNGAEPLSGGVVYLRSDAPGVCEIISEMPNRQPYFLDPVVRYETGSVDHSLRQFSYSECASELAI
jgi:hypothetical protein